MNENNGRNGKDREGALLCVPIQDVLDTLMSIDCMYDLADRKRSADDMHAMLKEAMKMYVDLRGQ